jgi:DNA-binding SARP family transcriptional activator
MAMPPSTELQVNMLGPPQLAWGGEPFEVPRRQVRGLLYYLAQAAEPVPRDRLAFLFWPDLPDHDARAHLKRLLSTLRHALPDGSLLQAGRGNIGLAGARLWCDVIAFEQLATVADPGAWAQAAALYRGPFLDGFSLSHSTEYDNWQAQMQSRLERHYLTTLSGLIDACRATGELDAAIEYARQALSVDNLAEDVHRRLIELHAARGDRRAATRRFEQCASILERELGVSPLPETRAAYEAAITARPAARPVAPRWDILPSLDLPLVGREDALQALAVAYRRLQAGGMILVSGEAGIGKSRLLQAFASTCGSTVLAAANPPGGQAVLYTAVAEALRQALSLPDRWQNIRPIWLAEAGRLLPEIGEVFPNLPRPVAVEPAQAQARLFEALSRCFLGLAAQGPLLLCLDDLHWADPATLGWLATLPRWLPGSHICLLASCRRAEDETLADVKRAFARPGLLAEMPLSHLTESDVTAILTVTLAHLPQAPADTQPLSAAIHKATGGNPFFVLETVRALLEAGRLAGPPDHLPLAATVQAAVQRRLERLSSLGRQALETAAVLAPDLTFDLLTQTGGRSAMETVQGLDELAQRQLLANGEQRRFSHDLVREVVYDGISPWRRRILHHRAAQALEATRTARDGPSRAAAWATVAGHYDRAGDAHEAVRCFEQAALVAQRLHAHQEAIGHAQRAIELCRAEPSQPDRLARLYTTLGDSQMVRGQHAAAEEAFANALALTPADDYPAQARLHGKLSGSFRARLLVAEAEAASDMALATLGQPADDWPSPWQLTWLELQVARMEILYYKGDLDRLAYLVAAIEPVVAAVDSPAYRFDYLSGLMDLALRREHYTLSDRTVALAETVLAMAQETGDLVRLARGWFRVGLARLWAGQTAAAAAPLLAGLHQAQEAGLAYMEVLCLTYLACLHRFLGDASEARRHVERSLAVCQEVDMPIYQAAAHANLAAQRRREGDVDAAQVEAEQALALWGEYPYPFRWLAYWVLLAVHAGRGDLETAVTQAQAILHPSQRRQPGDLPSLLENAVRAWPEHPDEARAALQQAIEIAQDEGYL